MTIYIYNNENLLDDTGSERGGRDKHNLIGGGGGPTRGYWRVQEPLYILYNTVTL